MHVTDAMIDRCKETLTNTDHTLRCWWQSYNPDQYYPVPFRKLLWSSSRTRYVTHWKQLLSYVFRMWRLDPDEQEKMSGVRLRGKETRQMEMIWVLLTRFCQAEIPTIAEGVFQLSVTFLKYISKHGRIADSAIVHFLGVQGILGDGTSFLRPYTYTSCLAAMLWISRLLMLEYALPQRSYSWLDLPERNTYDNQIERMNNVRIKYLLTGRFHPIGHIITILHYGRKISQVESGRSFIAGSQDSKRLYGTEH